MSSKRQQEISYLRDYLERWDSPTTTDEEICKMVLEYKKWSLDNGYTIKGRDKLCADDLLAELLTD